VLKGVWKSVQDTIILNTYKQPIKNKYQEFQYIDSKNGNIICLHLDSSKYQKIIVTGFSDSHNQDVKFKDTLMFRDSVFIPIELNVKKTSILPMNSNDGFIWFCDSVQNVKYDVYDLRVNKIEDERTCFVNKKCLIKGNKLYFQERDGTFGRSFLEKTSMKNKKFPD
jgi:hypothetical protein